MHKNVILLVFAWCLVCNAQTDQGIFNTLLFNAFEDNNSEQIKNLIKTHRLHVKPFVDDYLEQSIRSELNNNPEQSQSFRQMCSEIAQTFATIFNESSLKLAVSYLDQWDLSEKRQKIQADSLYATATQQRGKRDSRDIALQNYHSALKLYQDLKDQRGQASTLGGLGVVYWYKREPDSVLSFYQKGLVLRREIDDQHLIGNSLSDLGAFYRAFRKEYQISNEFYMKAAEVRAAIGDTVGLAKCYRMTGENFWDLGELSKAKDQFTQAFELYDAIGDSVYAGRVLHNSGILLRRMGRYPLSLEYFKRALPYREASGKFKDVSATLVEMATVYKKMGDFENALKQYQTQLVLYEERDDQQGIAQCLINIGTILNQLNRPERALKVYTRAEKIVTDENRLDVLSNLGVTYFELGDIEQAKKYHYLAITLSRNQKNLRTETNNLINLGNAFNSVDLDSALVFYRSALQIAQQLNDPALLFPVLLGFGDNYERRGKNLQAFDYYKQALTEIEKIHNELRGQTVQADFLATQRYIYEAIINLIVKMHNNDPTGGYDRIAFEYTEKAKARAFLDLMAEALAQVKKGADQSLLEEQNILLQEITTQKRKLRHQSQTGQTEKRITDSLSYAVSLLETRYVNLKNKIKKNNPQYAALQFPDVVSIPELQANCIDDETVILQYLVGDSSSVLWAITSESCVIFQLPPRSQIQDQVDVTRHALLNPSQKNIDVIRSSGFRLYQYLIEPAAELLKNKGHIIIIPDDILHYLPFEVLITRSASDLAYLFKTHSISYQPSATILAQLDDAHDPVEHRTNKAVLAIGNPLFSKATGLANLPYTDREVQFISSSISKSEQDILLKENATEENLRKKLDANSYRYIHFATHGLLDDKKPDFSAIALTGDEQSEESGLLHAAEIFNLRLNSEMVVLSACQSALGKMVRGEGIVGLTRAFMYAGVSPIYPPRNL
jgi:CHAT domain-containing protein/Tfp pilus assembly protein PilF